MITITLKRPIKIGEEEVLSVEATGYCDKGNFIHYDTSSEYSEAWTYTYGNRINKDNIESIVIHN